MNTRIRLLITGIFLAAVVATGCVPADVQRGDQFVAEGRWDEAVAAYRKAIKEDPFNDDLRAQLKDAKLRAAEQHYRAGKAAIKDGRVMQALQEFQWATGLDPSRREHRAGLVDALRLKEAREQLRDAKKLRSLGRLDDAMVAYERAVVLDPGLTEALEGVTTVTAQQRASKAITESPQPVTLRFQRAKLREVFEILARTAGVNVVFDKDVRDDPVTIFLKDMPYDDALKLILNTNNLRAHRVAPNTLLIVPNTKQKKAQYQDLMIRTFYLSNAKAKKVVNLLRSMLESKRVYADEDVNAVVVRDEPAKLHLAERVIHSIDRRQPEVMLEVEILEVDRTKSLEYGVNFAKEAGFGIVPPGVTGLTTTTTTFTLEQLTDLGKSSFIFTFPATVFLDFFKQQSDAKTLSAPKIRVLNKQKATINVGDKQPILLSTTNVLPGQAATGAVPTTSTVTSTEFKDTGVKLTVEPTVHLVDEVTLKFKIEVTRVGEQVILQESPEISQFRFGTRTAETTLRVRDGQTVVLAGLIAEERRDTKETVPWLDAIPILGELFTTRTKDTNTTELILTITPHIIRHSDTPGLEEQAFWSGTQTQFSTDRLFTPEPTMISFPSEDLPFSGSIEPDVRIDPSGLSQQPEPLSPAEPSPTQGSVEPGSAAPTLPTDPAESFLPVMPPVAATQPRTVVPAPEAPGPAVPPVVFQPPPQPEPPKVIARGPGILAIRPSRLVTRVGQHFRVDLTAQQLGNVSASVLTVTYDPQLLEFVRASEGPLLKQDGSPSGATVVESAGAGRIVLRLQRPGAGSPASGTLASLFFQAKSQGTSQLTLEPITASGPEGRALPLSVRPGAVVVR